MKQISLEAQALNTSHPNFLQIETPKCQKLNKINKPRTIISISILRVRRRILAVKHLLNIVTMRISWSVLSLLTILKRTSKTITSRIQIERKPKLY